MIHPSIDLNDCIRLVIGCECLSGNDSPRLVVVGNIGPLDDGWVAH